MQLLNSNIPQGAQTTIYSNKKAQDLLNLVLFMFCSFFVLQRWWREVDSNHRSRWQQIYSLLPLATRESLRMELVIGLEPTTCWLQISCSANWATPAFICVWVWCLGTESNHRHRDFQSLALPTELPRQIIYIKKWRPGRDSNPRPLAWQASVLTSWTTRPY